MLRNSPTIRYHIAEILAIHWLGFVAQYQRWIRPVVFENVRKVLACRTPVLGCHLYKCADCGHVEIIPHSCKSRFCPTCGKHATDPRYLMNHAGLKKRWKYQVTTRMKKAHRQGQFRLPSNLSFLKNYGCFAAMLNKLWSLTWFAHIGASLLDPRFSVQYIGRYTKRAVLAEYRITYYDGKVVRFSFRDYAAGGKTSYVTMKVNAFIGRLIRHVPDKHFPMVRHAGLFSNRWKGQYLTQARAALAQPQPEDSHRRSLSSWAERQAEHRGVDPLMCPHCQKPLVFVGAVFGPWEKVQVLFEQAGRDPTIPPLRFKPG